ncbi:MAG: type IX secretion system sortase PorU [Saprospiraceae bacterium]
MKNICISLILLVVLNPLFADIPGIISKTLNWEEQYILHNPTGNFETKILSFEGAVYNPQHPSLPIFQESFELDQYGNFDVTLVDAQFEPLDKAASPDDIFLESDITVNTTVEIDRKRYTGKIFFIPIRKINGRYEKLVSFSLRIRFTPQAKPISSVTRGPNTYNSILSDGEIYKIAIPKSGMYKIDRDFLANELNISVGSIDPRQIKIYGNGGGLLPESNDDFRYDDLEENAIWVAGEGDGSFDENDYLLFYAEGADKWIYKNNAYFYERNIYDNNNFYFLKVEGSTGKRVSTQASLSTTAYTTNAFDALIRYEEDRVNLLSWFTNAQGSGKLWFGDHFNTTRERSYNDIFNFPNLITSENLRIKTSFAARSANSSRYNVQVGGNTFNSSNISRVNVDDHERNFARVSTINTTFTSSSPNINVSVSYPSTGDGTNQGWLDYIEVQGRRGIRLEGNQLRFSDSRSLEEASTTFQVSNVNSNTLVWDISVPTNPKIQEVNSNGNNLSFGVSTENLREFIAFNQTANFAAPVAVGRIENQNVHEINDPHLVIIYHRNFEAAAELLADHRAQHSQIKVEIVRIDQIYNEFSSGRQSPTAIRDFAQMLHDRSDNFRYLLLMGDGSFDFKNINKLDNNENFIPVYETNQSLEPIYAFPSDDYYALLSPGEGANLQGALDIGVGRIPAKSALEAMNVVKKIINYDKNPSTKGDWQNRVTFVADDEDGNRHIKDADRVSNIIDTEHKGFNINKIYLDAFEQVATPGGERFPKATEALNTNMFKGHLVVNYLGHGGAKGWAQERVLTGNDISSWENPDKLPLFVTATCSFAGYDEPNLLTGGEQALLKESGGAIALFTTTRAVFSGANLRLTEAVFDTIFDKNILEVPSIGEILRAAKNKNSADTTGTNARKFTLLGDPSMQLAIPRYDVATTMINNNPVTVVSSDTIGALQKVTIAGEIRDLNNQLVTDFNGKVYPTIYDKKISISTLVQDSGSLPFDFKLQKSIIFKGTASVVNGKFEFSFVVPKDINYTFGAGKISYYAEDGALMDATGYYDRIIIGGTSDAILTDNEGPAIEVFMNNEDFVSGGLTDENPTLFIKLSDDNGINIVGNSIGHDLTGVLDNDTKNTYILNDFYEAALDDYTQGEIKYPLFDIAPGLHRISVKAWDVANNSSESSTEFVVANTEDVALDHVLNFPNPFTSQTSFIFEHNLPDQLLDVQIRIFSVSGRLVKTIEEKVFADGYRVTRDQILWNGTDEYGDDLGRGVYLYKVKVRSGDNPTLVKAYESEFEKLVILK